MIASRRTALAAPASLAAGILYLVTHVSSVAAAVAYGPALTDPSSSAAEAAATGLRVGVLLELVLAFACVGTGIALAWMLDDPVTGVDAEMVAQALADVHRASFLVGQGLVIGVNTLVLAVMLHRTKTVPLALAALGLVGGTLVLASDVGQFAGWIPLNGVVAGLCAAPIFAFELWFAGYLLFRGLRPRVAAPTVEAHRVS